MKSILFIGCNKSGSSREAIEAAVEMGFFTILLTDRQKFLDQRTEFTEVHEMILIDFNNRELIKATIHHLQEVQGKKICSIISLIDPYVHLAAELAKEFCDSPVTGSAILWMEDKILTHNILGEHALTPKYKLYDEDISIKENLQNLGFPFPIVVKSPKSSGSKDVFIAENMPSLEKDISILLRRYGQEPIILEEFLDGPQFLVEAIVWGNEVHLIAIIEQEITRYNQRSIITGYAVLTNPPETLENSLTETVTKIIRLFGMEFGTCHLELRLVKGEWRLIEINPRISGGAMNQMIFAAYGINLAKETLKVYLGEKPSLSRRHEYSVFTKYLVSRSSGILEKVTGKKRALAHSGVYQVYIKPRAGSLISTPTSMGNRYAYVIARAESIAQAKSIAKHALQEIKLHLISL